MLKKNKVNKFDYTEHNIYLVTSDALDFEDEDVSPDGKRLKTELMELLVNIKIDKPLDLFNKHSRQLINFKAIFLRNKIAKHVVVSGFKSSAISIIPFADIYAQNKIESDYKDYFLDQFGIKKVMDLVKNNEDIYVNDANVIPKNTE